jgi:hypothetical protein
MIKETDFSTPVVLVVNLQKLLVSLNSLLISDASNSTIAQNYMAIVVQLLWYVL